MLSTPGDGLTLLDDAQLDDLMRLFARHDADLDGGLALPEFCSLMRQLEMGDGKAEAEDGDEGGAEDGARAGAGGVAGAGGGGLGARLAFQRAKLGCSGSVDLNELVILLGSDAMAASGRRRASAGAGGPAFIAARGAAPRGTQRLASHLGLPPGKREAPRHVASQRETYDALLVAQSTSAALEHTLEQLGDAALERAKRLFEAFDADRRGSLGLAQFAALLNRAARNTRAPGTAWAQDPTAARPHL